MSLCSSAILRDYVVNGKPYVSAKLYYDTRTGMTDPLRGDIF